MAQECEVRVRFHRPQGLLARYFTTFYVTDIVVPGAQRVSDQLHPEWGNLRFHKGAPTEARSHSGDTVSGCDFIATGPSAHTLHFTLGNTRSWGVGLLPLGWAKFVAGPADELANRICDGRHHPAFAGFAGLADTVFGPELDEAAELARITQWFSAAAAGPTPDEERIVAVHAALVDPDLSTVADLAQRSGLSPRTLERVCRRAFGFAPKLLLRRQRFMRSLAQFMLDPSLLWIGAIDGSYHDQAQFVREFRQFMGVSPREYANAPHPILSAIVNERALHAGAAVQTLDRPRVEVD